MYSYLRKKIFPPSKSFYFNAENRDLREIFQHAFPDNTGVPTITPNDVYPLPIRSRIVRRLGFTRASIHCQHSTRANNSTTCTITIGGSHYSRRSILHSLRGQLPESQQQGNMPLICFTQRRVFTHCFARNPGPVTEVPTRRHHAVYTLNTILC